MYYPKRNYIGASRYASTESREGGFRTQFPSIGFPNPFSFGGISVEFQMLPEVSQPRPLEESKK